MLEWLAATLLSICLVGVGVGLYIRAQNKAKNAYVELEKQMLTQSVQLNYVQTQLAESAQKNASLQLQFEYTQNLLTQAQAKLANFDQLSASLEFSHKERLQWQSRAQELQSVDGLYTDLKTRFEQQSHQLKILSAQANEWQTTQSLYQDLQARFEATNLQLSHTQRQLSELQALPSLYAQLKERAESYVKLIEHKDFELKQRAQAYMDLSVQVEKLKAQLNSQMEQAEQMRILLNGAQQSFTEQFKVLAQDILEDKSKRFSEQNQSALGSLMDPMHLKMNEFTRLIQDTYDKDSKERMSLEIELKRMRDMNERLGQDALALTQALTGGNQKTQGTWGELVLERVLEASGLSKDREYRIQVSDVVDTGEGLKRYQPDVIIDLPDGKNLVIDSKVSLNAYVRSQKSVDETLRASELKAHVQAIRTHIRLLSEKRYQDLYQLKTLDFVFMFIPVEPAYLAAVQADMDLFNEAFERRIMIVGPSTLLATLRTVQSIWRYEYQNQNAEEIARQGGALYDKFVGLVESLERLGKQMDTSQDGLRKVMTQLRNGRGNLLSRAENLRLLGAKTSKQLSAVNLEVEDPVVALTPIVSED